MKIAFNRCFSNLDNFCKFKHSDSIECLNISDQRIFRETKLQSPRQETRNPFPKPSNQPPFIDPAK